MIHPHSRLGHLALSSALALLTTAGYGQNTNNGVIINNIIVPPAEPIYVPPVPVYTGPNEVDRAQEKIAREARANAATYYSGGADFLSKRTVYDNLYDDKPTYHTTQVVNMRTQAGTNSPITRSLPKGAVVKIISSGQPLDNGWWEVFLPGTNLTGYVHPKYLRPQR